MNKERKTCIYIKFFSPFLSIINKGVKVKTKSSNFSPPFCHKQRTKEGVNQINQERLYAIYIHEEEDGKVTPYTYTLHERGMTSPNSHNA